VCVDEKGVLVKTIGEVLGMSVKFDSSFSLFAAQEAADRKREIFNTRVGRSTVRPEPSLRRGEGYRIPSPLICYILDLLDACALIGQSGVAAKPSWEIQARRMCHMAINATDYYLACINNG
jgi:hypothetical protein